MHGIDCSHYQGYIDFKTLKDNADFIIIKATEGINVTDSAYVRNRETARKFGLRVGFYHYARPAINSPIAEADYFCKVVSCLPGEIICLDFEENYPDPVSWCKTFLDRTTSNMGFKPYLYLNHAIIKAHDWTSVVNSGYPLWLAYWNFIDTNQTSWDTPWPTVLLRQFSDKGNVAGMNPVDLDVFYGEGADWDRFGNPPPPTTTTTTTTTSSTTSTTTISYTTTQPIPSNPSFLTELWAWIRHFLHKS